MRNGTILALSCCALSGVAACTPQLVDASGDGLLQVVAGISESRSSTGDDAAEPEVVRVADENGTSVLSGRVVARGEYQLFELGAGHAGESWLVTDARVSLGRSPFAVALFDGNFELLRRDAVHADLPLEHVLRADADVLYLGVMPLPGNAGGDFEFEVTHEPGHAIPSAAPQLVWLNFGGASDVSVHARRGLSFGAFEAGMLGPAYADATAEIRAALVATMREDYAGYNVTITTSEEGPAPVEPHATIHFGANDDRLLGLADNVDQYNEDPWQTAVIYVEGFADFAVMGLSVEEMGQMVGNVASHELGHLLGLFHTQAPADVMDTTGTAWDLAGNQLFSRADLEASVFPYGYLNCPQRLAETVGHSATKPLAKAIQPERMARKAGLRALVRQELRGRCATCLHLDD
jgi:hypothetical protein